MLLVISAHFVCKSQVSIDAKTAKSDLTKGGMNRRLFWVGIAGIILGLIFYRLDPVIPPHMYGAVFGTYFLFIGVVSLLIWHLQFKDGFLVRSAVSISAILVIYKQYGDFILTAILWAPVLALAVINANRKTYSPALRIAAIGFTVAMILITLLRFSIPILGPFRFFPYPKETTILPAEFPDYLRAPDGASQVRYRGGENPYLEFVIHEAYPAADTISYMSDRFEQAGWIKLDYDVMNPNLESSHLKGWYNPAEYWLGLDNKDEESKCDKGLRQWEAWWTNNKDEILCMRISPITDKVAEEKPSYHCTCSKYSSDSWMQNFLMNYKRIHQIGEQEVGE